MRKIIFFLVVIVAVVATVSADYTLQVQALTNSPANGATVYLGVAPSAPVATVSISTQIIPTGGWLNVTEIYDYSGTAGTNQAYSYYIRVNNTQDYLVNTLSVATSERVFSNTTMGIQVFAGDFFEVKRIQPTWTTNPLTNIVGGYVLIDTPDEVDRGYPIYGMALSNSPADGATNYLGSKPSVPETVEGRSKIFIPTSGSITQGHVNDYSGTAGTAEAYSYSMDVNSTDYLIETESVSANSRFFDNNSMSIPVQVGNYLEFKRLHPTWATNPLTNVVGGTAWVNLTDVHNIDDGYPIHTFALTHTPGDAQTTYFGDRPIAPSTTAGTNKIYIRQDGWITKAGVYSYSGTAGSAEAWTMYIRVNNAVDYLIESKTISANERMWINTSMDIPVVAGDYVEIKSVTSTMATNPATTIYGGGFYMEYEDDLPIAQFTSTTPYGYPPHSVTFTDTSYPTVSSWDWYWTNIENSTTVHFNTTQNPVQSFDIGHFYVGLDVTNSSGHQNATAGDYLISVTDSGGYTGYVQQDLWLYGQYILTIHVTDKATGIPILVATVMDSNGQSYSCTNGTAYLTEPAGSVVVYTMSDGYDPQVSSYIIDSDETRAVQMEEQTVSNSSQVQYSSTHNVKILVKDAWKGPLEGVNVTATYVEASGPFDWLFAWIGVISGSGANVQNTTLFGHTGSDGAINFLMVESVQYNITAYQEGVINQKILIYPKDDEYTIWSYGVNKSFLYESGYNELDVVRVGVNGTEENQTWGKIMVKYSDSLAQTQMVHIHVNQTHIYGNFTNQTEVTNTTVTGSSNFTATLWVRNQRDQSYNVYTYANHTILGNITRGYGVTFPPGPISLGMPENLLHLIGMGLLFFIVLLFVRTLPGETTIVVVFFIWVFFLMGWWRELAHPAIVFSAACGSTVFAIIYNVMLRSKKLPLS
jgi:hypothetical protein